MPPSLHDKGDHGICNPDLCPVLAAEELSHQESIDKAERAVLASDYEGGACSRCFGPHNVEDGMCVVPTCPNCVLSENVMRQSDIHGYAQFWCSDCDLDFTMRKADL